ncbi:carbohydrate kinase family protein [Marinactinospora thermotolerans]|uniref:Fructokinase n=1 Tax=Marinactinospora thermotolerans DSM 45154 TaxID=1122192 RepID=A0A1T4M4U8_9ACTN|nr:carbohydrate kinase [Marinactinospora thermotolerans]SJZ61798.1 fructokinase [Marinactinospora thermotolerans DSM 45154]
MITVVGEALIDLISAESGTYRAAPGGAPTNTAVALARLGTPASLLARIGSDRFGRRLRGYITSCGVDGRDLVSASEPSTLAIADIDEAGHAEYGFYVNGTADWQWRPEELPDPVADDVTALHVGSLALALAPGSAVLEKWIARQRERVTVSYDPNIRPALAGDPATERERVERQIALADIVKASDEDVRWLYPGRSVEETARFWAGLGPRLVFVTRGGEGTVALRGGADPLLLVRTPPAVKVADTVGAGDAFAAGVLDALDRNGVLGAAGRDRLASLDAQALAACLDHAHWVSGRVCERVGADPGPLDPPQVRFPATA